MDSLPPNSATSRPHTPIDASALPKRVRARHLETEKMWKESYAQLEAYKRIFSWIARIGVFPAAITAVALAVQVTLELWEILDPSTGGLTSRHYGSWLSLGVKVAEAAFFGWLASAMLARTEWFRPRET